MDWIFIATLAVISVTALIVAIICTLAGGGAIIPVSFAVGICGVFATVKTVEWKLAQ